MSRNIKIAFALVAGLLLWFATGIFSNDEKAPAGAQGEQGSGAPFEVLVVSSVPENFRDTIVARAVTAPNRAVELQAEVSGRIEALPVAKGARVSAGDVVCRLAEDDRPELVEQAKSALERAQMEYRGAQQLKKQGLQSDIEIARAKAEVDRARAELARYQLALDNLTVEAPFGGYLDERPVELGQFLRVGDTCGRLVEIDPIKVVANVSRDQVGRFEPGATVEIRLGGGRALPGRIDFVASTAHPQTKTYRVEALLDNGRLHLRGGQAVNMAVSAKARSAHRLPGSALSLNAAGDLEISLVDEDDRVFTRPVTILGESDGSVWVTGLPDPARVIVRGHDYVAPGDRVAVSEVSGGGAG